MFETSLFEWAGRSFGISSSTQLNSDLSKTTSNIAVDSIGSGTILEYYNNNKNTHKDIFITIAHYPDDAPVQAEGRVQFLRDTNGQRAIALFYPFSPSNYGIWRRTIYSGAWRAEWVKIL